MDKRSEYRYSEQSRLGHHLDYLAPPLIDAVRHVAGDQPLRIFDLGCGDGSVAAMLAREGHKVEGVDPSVSGIESARRSYPDLRFEVGSAYDDLHSKFGSFPLVVSLEVVEHVYAPRDYASTLFNLVEPGGRAILSTPYHGYWKNLALALSGQMDNHFTALWDNGHIKFWSIRTLGILLHEAGFQSVVFQRIGRVPALAKSLFVVARR